MINFSVDQHVVPCVCVWVCVCLSVCPRNGIVLMNKIFVNPTSVEGRRAVSVTFIYL